MRIFVRVAEEGSFTAAAGHFDVTTAFVSRSVSSLETHLRSGLLNRSTRRVALTRTAAWRWVGIMGRQSPMQVAHRGLRRSARTQRFRENLAGGTLPCADTA